MLAIHRNEEAAPALRDRGCRVLYPPPYSPDLDPIDNPIERAFSKLKAQLGRIGASIPGRLSGRLEKSATFTRR